VKQSSCEAITVARGASSAPSSRRSCDAAPDALVGRLGRAILALALAAAPLAGCTEAKSPTAERPQAAEKWFKRAEQDFGQARVDDAHEAIQKALSLAPGDPEVRLLGARVALARLEYDETIRLLKGVQGSDAQGLRGRAYWYKGDLSQAADELEGMLNDPEIRDDWAKAIAGLARRGEGRTPFQTSGGMLAPVEMAQVSPIAPYLVIPVEIDGEQALAMLSTGMAEVVVDSSSRSEPSWISLRLGGRLEVADVPALTQDLSGVSKELGAPIKALLGVNLLRHLNVTIDYTGHQFVARTYAATPPPNATRLSLFYARGGGMVVSAPLGAAEDARAALFVDSGMRFPIALDERGWAKAGITAGDLKSIPGDPEQKLKEGVVPLLKLGAFDLRRVPGVLGAPVSEIEKGLKLDVDGIIGSPILANYRITLADGGRVMWIEDDTFLQQLEDEEDSAEVPAPGAPLNEGEMPPMLGDPGGLGGGFQLGLPSGDGPKGQPGGAKPAPKGDKPAPKGDKPAPKAPAKPKN
jgi:tetratricopeptide (TPR) repeat protein